MVEVNGAEQEVQDPELIEDEPDARKVEADGLVQQLREELRAAQADRKEVAEVLAAAQAERAEVAELKAAAKAAMEQAEAAQKESDATKTKAATAASQAQKSAATAKQHEDSITATSGTVQNTLGTVTANAKAIGDHATQVEQDAKTTARLAKKSETVEARVKEYEDGFEGRNSRADVLADRVESLLPGATSAGLAESFLKSRKSKTLPKVWWLSLFLASMGLLGWSLFWDLPWMPSSESATGIDWLYLLGRVPLVLIFGTVAWVSLVYFRTESRMQDDYRHKQDLAASYDGFRKLMSDERETADGSPASYALAMRMLEAINAPPGRMYDKKGEAYTPAESVINAIVERVTERVRKGPGAGK